MAATPHCDNFVGNAWKKDLCLNCFKSKEEHQLKNGEVPRVPPRIPDPPKEGILKAAKPSSANPKGNRVIFQNQEYEVIGFGGDDVYSDEEDVPDSSSHGSNDGDYDDYDNEEERAFQRLTKSNTDYNSIPENLQEPKEGEAKKLIEPLKLGKQLLDDKGNKKTLLVSVTPFGGQPCVKTKTSIKVNVPVEEAKPTIEKTEPVQSNGEKEEAQVALENPKLEIAQTNEDDGSNKSGLKRSQPLDKNSKFRPTRDQETPKEQTEEVKTKISTSEKVSNLIDKAKKKVNQFPVIEAQNLKYKSNTLLSNKKLDKNKPVVLDIYHVRDEVKANNEKNEEKTIKSILLSPEMRNKFLSSELKIAPSLLEVKTDNRSNSERSKLVPNISSLYRQFGKTVAAENGTSEEGNKSKDVPVSTSLNTSVTIVPNISYKFTDEVSPEPKKSHSCVRMETFVPNTVILTDDMSDVSPNSCSISAQKDEEFSKSSFDSFEKFETMIKGEEITLFSASRESAGEPDGRADSDDLSEPPALPLNPPPTMDPRTSFLQDLTMGGEGLKKMFGEKPKVPAKPIIIQSKKINFNSPVHTNRPKSPSMEKFLDMTSPTPVVTVKNHPPLQETPSNESVRIQKRPAPKPPSPKEDAVERVARVTDFVDVETCRQRETEPEPETEDAGPVEPEPMLRLSRSTENLLELMGDQEKTPPNAEDILVPEPTPRRSLSLSQDSLLASGIGEVQSKKKSNRGRFSLRKLLHLGKHKDGTKEPTPRHRTSLPMPPKAKLEIIHPIDLNGARVEVVPPVRTSKSRRTSSSASSSSGEQRESDVLSDSSTSHSVSSSGNDSHTTTDKSKKPPPPPRSQSLDAWSNKPARPPPPKSIDLQRHLATAWTPAPTSDQDNLYVNLGEARSGLAPNKPVRTGSLRDTTMEGTKRLVAVSSQPEDSGYESFDVSLSTVQSMPSSLQTDDNVYECVQVSQQRSSSPECDSIIPESPNPSYNKIKRTINTRNHSHRRSEGSVDLSQDYLKMKFMRSVSLPYCASETESEIYSPYSFYGSEMGEEDYDLSPTSSRALRMSRLKLKKGRSIVHKNLEDNYGAVIVANHEALAQVVEHMHQGPVAPPALRSLSTAANLRWTDFTIAKDAVGVVVERRVFYPAYWGVHNVTLSLMAEQGLNSSLNSKGPFNLNPLTELNDLVPAEYLPMLRKDDSELVQASISVLTRLQVETLMTYARNLCGGALSEESKKEVNFVLLQIINALKSLQAQGIEEAPKTLSNLIVCREERDPHPRVCMTNYSERADDTSKCSLCQCATNTLTEILPATDLTGLITEVLRKEKAVSLSQAKSILEFTLWGPADIEFGSSSRERESALQRWLDLERATVLHGLVRTRAELTVFEEWHLLFLVRTNAKMMAEASLLLESDTAVVTAATS